MKKIMIIVIMLIGAMAYSQDRDSSNPYITESPMDGYYMNIYDGTLFTFFNGVLFNAKTEYTFYSDYVMGNDITKLYKGRGIDLKFTLFNHERNNNYGYLDVTMIIHGEGVGDDIRIMSRLCGTFEELQNVLGILKEDLKK